MAGAMGLERAASCVTGVLTFSPAKLRPNKTLRAFQDLHVLFCSPCCHPTGAVTWHRWISVLIYAL